MIEIDKQNNRNNKGIGGMKMVEKIKELVNKLNAARDNYYNNANKNGISDFEYDKMFDELTELEKETNFIMSNSPTQEVGYTVLDKLPKVLHKYPMLSLDKTKQSKELLSFVNDKEALLMFKMDGMTCCATYDEEGNLISCESRGNGTEGSLITSNGMTFLGLPHKINHKGGLVVFGEAIIDYPTFYSVNEKLSEDSKYKNPRNLCAGSVSLLDSKECAKRGIRFVAWRLVYGYEENSFSQRLIYLTQLGFDIVPWIMIPHELNVLEERITEAKAKANELGLPIDGLVVSLDSVSEIEAMGMTSHHLKGQLAFKYFEDREFTTLREIEWSPSRTQITPVAIFDPIELSETTVSRASLHNLDIMQQLNIKIGSQVEVCKRNEIIPNIESCDGIGEDIEIIKECPVCGAPTAIIESSDGTHTLVCTSESCSGKLLGKLELFCGKEGLDIQGLSTSQLQVFISHGWIKNIADIYNLKEYRNEIIKLDGFAQKGTDKLLDAIDASRYCKMANFIRSIGIDLIGKTASKQIDKFCNNDIKLFNEVIDNGIDLSKSIEGFGYKMNKSFHDWFSKEENIKIFTKLLTIVEFCDTVSSETETNQNYNTVDLQGQTFCITGSVNHFKNRDEFVSSVEQHNGKYLSGVSAKLDWLVNNDVASTSGKNKKMHELGKANHIISEQQYLNMIKK